MDIALKRYLDVQENTFWAALDEIKSGHKKSHWMWFIFPELRGLGKSDYSIRYGIRDMKEAKDFLNHAVLGARLIEITHELLYIKHSNPTLIFGKPDDRKLKSCMTLFFLAENSNDSIFKKVLDKYFNGEMDTDTLKLLRKS